MKKTEIGLIPEDWEVFKIKDISLIKTGSKNTQDRIKNGNYPFFVRSQTIERINSYAFEGEAILTAGDGVGVGKVFHYVNERFDIHQRVYMIHNFRKDVSGFYFFKYFQNHFLARIMQMTAKSSVDSVRMETISEMPIPLPPLAEQEAIATALGDCDAWIDSIEQVLAKKRLIKQGAMQELLTHSTSSGQAKEDWEEISLIEIAEEKRDLFNDGDWIESEHIKSDGIRLIQTGNIGVGKFLNRQNRKYINDKSFSDLKCKELFAGDLLICRLAEPAGRACVFPKTSDSKTVTSVDVTIFRPDVKKYNRDLLMYIMCTDEWFKNVIEQVGGTTHKRISRGNLGLIKINIPKSLSEQTRIATILSDMDLEIEALEEELEKARQIKQGMMQELLTGRVRLV